MYAGGQREHAGQVADTARKLVSRNGATNVTAIVDAAEGVVDAAAEARRMLQLDPQNRWLDDEQEWLFLPTGRNRAANHLRKMLAIANSQSTAALRPDRFS